MLDLAHRPMAAALLMGMVAVALANRHPRVPQSCRTHPGRRPGSEGSMRYQQLHRAVVEKQPTAILEIGTWNGVRALEMLSRAPRGCRYYGFDLFEDATSATDEEEKNVKPHHSAGRVQLLLKDYPARLYRGNTRETLAHFSEPVDFVWIDGGHSVETIRSDWENVRRVLTPGAWVFFDDYYTGGIDTSRFGCNEIVKDLRHEVLPDADPVAGGGFVQMVKVYGDADAP
jgi:predicted O-methyltransferase YrrM